MSLRNRHRGKSPYLRQSCIGFTAQATCIFKLFKAVVLFYESLWDKTETLLPHHLSTGRRPVLVLVALVPHWSEVGTRAQPFFQAAQQGCEGVLCHSGESTPVRQA